MATGLPISPSNAAMEGFGSNVGKRNVADIVRDPNVLEGGNNPNGNNPNLQIDNGVNSPTSLEKRRKLDHGGNLAPRLERPVCKSKEVSTSMQYSGTVGVQHMSK